MNKILVYSRDVKANGKTFTVYKGIIGTKSYVDIQLWDDVEKRLTSDMKSFNLRFPVLLTLEDKSDYYAKKKTTKKDDKEYLNYKVYIKHYEKIEQGEFPQNRTLDDIIAELENIGK